MLYLSFYLLPLTKHFNHVSPELLFFNNLHNAVLLGFTTHTRNYVKTHTLGWKNCISCYPKLILKWRVNDEMFVIDTHFNMSLVTIRSHIIPRVDEKPRPKARTIKISYRVGIQFCPLCPVYNPWELKRPLFFYPGLEDAILESLISLW